MRPRASQPALPSMNRHGCVVADPPWSYENQNTGGSMTSGAAAKYQTMSADEVAALGPRVRSAADRDAYLLLWVPSPLLDVGLDTVRAWRARYRAAIYWDKVRMGMGFWVRNDVEVCLVASWGDAAPLRFGRNRVSEKSRFHSRKPDEFWRRLNEALDRVGVAHRLELFAREERAGWSRWGLEAPPGDRRVAL